MPFAEGATRGHVEETPRGPRIGESAEGLVVRGLIEWDDEEDGRIARLVIDGKLLRGRAWWDADELRGFRLEEH